jgi:hypothetical protein
MRLPVTTATGAKTDRRAKMAMATDPMAVRRVARVSQAFKSGMPVPWTNPIEGPAAITIPSSTAIAATPQLNPRNATNFASLDMSGSAVTPGWASSLAVTRSISD